MAKVTDMLTAADEKGYFAFAREGSKIADRVVTEFSEEDVQALGDNVVTILNAVKEMTQPEVMGLVQRTAISVQDVEEAHIEPPSMFALLKSDAGSADPPRPGTGHGNASHRRRGAPVDPHHRREVRNAHRHDCGPRGPDQRRRVPHRIRRVE
jgi:hypothetical protein